MSEFQEYGFFCSYTGPGLHVSYLWFRVLGYGLHFRWTKPGYQPLFSERYGHTKVLKIGRFWIKGLKP